MNDIILSPIGIIHSPHKKPRGTPIQPAGAGQTPGKVEIFPQFAEGLKDIEGFSHLVLLYHCHLCDGYKMMVEPFLDREEHGVFATRAPARPNPIGMSIVRLVSVEKNYLNIIDVDIVDKTPLIDIKPHVPAFHVHGPKRMGWLEKNLEHLKEKKDDERFRGR